jgi:hypothetical protein
MPCSTAEQVDELCERLASPQARIKYGSAKQLLRLSEEDPDLLYPRFDFFVRLMDSENRIFRWNARRILGNLARVDSQGRIEKIFDRFFAPIVEHEMISAANTMQGGAAIACAKPLLADRIALQILKVRHARYAGPECHNVAVGHAIVALGRFFQHVERKAAVLSLVAEARENPRPATRKKAEKFWAKAETAFSRM